MYIYAQRVIAQLQHTVTTPADICDVLCLASLFICIYIWYVYIYVYTYIYIHTYTASHRGVATPHKSGRYLRCPACICIYLYMYVYICIQIYI